MATRAAAVTPQARDDFALTDEHTAIGIDVLRNDLGGNAGRLLWFGDVAPSGVPVAGTSHFGARLTVTDGVLHYAPGESAAIRALAAGEQLQDSFSYQIRLGNGVTSSGVAHVTVTGSNDAAQITGSAAGAVREDDAQTAAGSLVVSDPDHGESLFGAIGPLTGRYGSFRFDAGRWSYTLDNAAAQALGAGERATETLLVKSFDGTASQQIVVTVAGANDVPVVLPDASVASGTVIELSDRSPGENSALLSASGSLAFADADARDSFTATARATGSGYVGAFTLVPPDAQHHSVGWTFAVADGELDALAAGETRVQTYELRVADGAGGSVTQQVSVTLQGSADAANPRTPDAYVAVFPGTGTDTVLLDLAAGSGAPFDAAATVAVPIEGSMGGVATGDLDGDGRTDVVRADSLQGQAVRVVLNRDADHDGSPEFVVETLAAPQASGKAGDVAVGDVNLDGRADILLGTSAQDVLYLGLGDSDGDGLPDFRRVELPALNGTSWGVAIGDLDGDGRPDLVVGGWHDAAYIGLNRGDANGDGVPEFAFDTGAPGSSAGMGHMALGDVDGDGRLDMLAPSYLAATSHALYLNRGDADGDGRLEFDRVDLAMGSAALDSALADLDGDGDLDALVFESDRTCFFLNQGDAGADGRPDFVLQVLASRGGFSGSVGDIDGDGDTDFIRPTAAGVEAAENLGDANGDGVIDWSVSLVGTRAGWDAVLLDL